jgi:hypothetical protein
MTLNNFDSVLLSLTASLLIINMLHQISDRFNGSRGHQPLPEISLNGLLQQFCIIVPDPAYLDPGL